MTRDGEEVLQHLETVTAQLAAIFEPSTFPDFDSDASGALLVQRAELIAQLSEALDQDRSVSYVEFNRLVIVQAQGSQVVSSLMAVRTALGQSQLQTQRQRAYADCLQGLIAPPPSQCLEKA